MTPDVKLEFNVIGDPVSEPRPRFDKRTGRTYVPNSADAWKHAVRAATKFRILRELRPDETPFASPMAFNVVLDFRLKRPKSHLRMGRNSDKLRVNAPDRHTTRPDVDNLAKAVLDAIGAFEGLPSLIWCDDAQVISLRATKRYACSGELPGVAVAIHQTSRAP